VNIAPWWGEAYYNLSRALEVTGQYDLAVKNLNYYLELSPPEAEARAARAHLSEIQTEQETAARKK
jgi:tetratricopeptide (TPR) repeat protein